MVRIFVAGMVWLNLLFFLHTRDSIRRGYSDFAVFYTAGTILQEGLGHQLYDKGVQFAVQEKFTGHLSFRQGALPYIHPPFEALIFEPLSRLPYTQAFIVWDLLSLVGLFGVAVVLRRSIGSVRAIPAWKLVLGGLAFYPILACLFQGQDSILQLLLCALVFHSLKKGADLRAGCWLALASFKFQFTVPILLLLVLWKRKNVVLGFAAVAVVLGIISAALVGRDALMHYPGYALQVVNTPGHGGVPPALLPNLHGLAQGWSWLFSGRMGAAIALFISAALFVFAFLSGRSAPPEKGFELQFALAILVSVLIAWQTNAHDVSLLILPLALVADYSFRQSDEENRKKFRWLLPISPLLISPLWMVLWLSLGHINLMAGPILWWAWWIGSRLRRDSRAMEKSTLAYRLILGD